MGKHVTDDGGTLIVQRVVVRWSKQSRGAEGATRRRHIPRAFPLPSMPDAPLRFHDVLAQERTGYTPSETIKLHALPADLKGLLFKPDGTGVVVMRTPAWHVFPYDRRAVQVFRLLPGELARYLANYRFSGYSTDWYYEEWTVHIAYAPWRADLFLRDAFDHVKDERVTLYGGRG
ncbi:hypothetical protein Pth03_57230 [Planotetraspora thailandica]|uniref:Uncharacterized protein n=1 Tax=Planotetraspora thailandica TaxID=487172 RepID=A0A8J3XY07_9ACTN|nr:hypothetical protein [Planotetraspora thailandica]GII57334.1 hypothetical protein Pth03_57230 [Planotetraspora thailandica]